MKIHGTAKGGALSTKDFGVAFGGAAAGCSNFPNSLGTGADGAVTGSVIDTADPKIGVGCLSQDGTDDFTNIDGAEGFSTTVGTISFWVNPSSTANGGVLCFADTSTNERLEISLAFGTLNVIMALSSGVQWESNQTGIDLDTWHNIVLVQDGVAVKFYSDNVEQTVFANSTDKSKWLTGNIDNARIGCVNRNNQGNIDFWNGLVDDVGLWDTAIDSATRDTIYNSGTGAAISTLSDCTGIKAYYNCNSLTNSTLLNNAVPIS